MCVCVRIITVHHCQGYVIWLLTTYWDAPFQLEALVSQAPRLPKTHQHALVFRRWQPAGPWLLFQGDVEKWWVFKYSKNKHGENDLTDLITLKNNNIIEWICSQHVHISDVYVYNFTYIYIHICKHWEIIVFVSMLFFKRRNGMLDPNDKCLLFGRVETTNQNISYHSPNSWNIASTQYIGKVDLG